MPDHPAGNFKQTNRYNGLWYFVVLAVRYWSDHSLPCKKESESLNDCGFANVVRAEKNSMLRQYDAALLNTSEVLQFKLADAHYQLLTLLDTCLYTSLQAIENNSVKTVFCCNFPSISAMSCSRR
jgi:hypothetical protein